MALATERPAIDLRVLGGIALRVHPGRGLDIGAAWFRGTPLAWIGPTGEGGAEADDWRAAWGGGLVTTCGLDNVVGGHRPPRHVHVSRGARRRDPAVTGGGGRPV